MKVIIPCGGKNTRAKPAIGDYPKALYPVPNKPALGRILDWVMGTDFSSVYVVVNPKYTRMFQGYCDKHYKELNIELIEQPSPAGDGDAIRIAFENAHKPFKYSREPLLVVLGDKIPHGTNADVFQGHLNVPDDRKPPYSRLGMQQSNSGTRLTIAGNKFVNSIRERRNEDSVDGLYFNGVAYIKRGDYLYDKLRILRGAKLKSYGEYRIGSALKEMFHFGESFHGLEMQTLTVGNPEGIEEAIHHYG